eukprot:NODE_417_length_1523_cov_90.183381_g385_i0.p1 GENE.NODE_417_length_1523_cov_90.183381_g385_i0~~NODE_417_length_1523_cov_90.183381_g385_i0.p1  ORF type:complete len:348 (+),score=29.33 NODE_417_length_1523_cov_90.183381_g385_i0:56-1099(+)
MPLAVCLALLLMAVPTLQWRRPHIVPVHGNASIDLSDFPHNVQHVRGQDYGIISFTTPDRVELYVNLLASLHRYDIDNVTLVCMGECPDVILRAGLAHYRPIALTRAFHQAVHDKVWYLPANHTRLQMDIVLAQWLRLHLAKLFFQNGMGFLDMDGDAALARPPGEFMWNSKYAAAFEVVSKCKIGRCFCGNLRAKDDPFVRRQGHLLLGPNQGIGRFSVSIGTAFFSKVFEQSLAAAKTPACWWVYYQTGFLHALVSLNATFRRIGLHGKKVFEGTVRLGGKTFPLLGLQSGCGYHHVSGAGMKKKRLALEGGWFLKGNWQKVNATGSTYLKRITARHAIPADRLR